jgi:hypothetical protein
MLSGLDGAHTRWVISSTSISPSSAMAASRELDPDEPYTGRSQRMTES